MSKRGKALVAAVWSCTLLGCSAPDDAVVGECAPNALLPDPACRDAGAADADAGDDAAAPEDPRAIDCENDLHGRCVAEPSGDPPGETPAGEWPRTPLLLWVGPADDMPASCPKEVPWEKYRRYSGLVAPPATCEPCSCDAPTGTCSGLPASIDIRTTSCEQSGGMSVPFDGPAGWDGSCTNATTLPAGAQCDGELCAQYVGASALPGPTEEPCTVTTETPAVTKERSWLLGGLACEVEELDGVCRTCDEDGTCEPTGERCMRDLPPPWLHCVALQGDHACPGNYTYARYLMFGEMPVDDRGCSACTCGAPEEGLCTAKLHLYKDAACAVQLMDVELSSVMDACNTINPPGPGIGSKAITGLEYVPGTCEASGGEPIGEANEDADTAVTFCCAWPFHLLK